MNGSRDTCESVTSRVPMKYVTDIDESESQSQSNLTCNSLTFKSHAKKYTYTRRSQEPIYNHVYEV